MERLFGSGFRSFRCSISPVSSKFLIVMRMEHSENSSDVLNDGKAEKLEIGAKAQSIMHYE